MLVFRRRWRVLLAGMSRHLHLQVLCLCNGAAAMQLKLIGQASLRLFYGARRRWPHGMCSSLAAGTVLESAACRQDQALAPAGALPLQRSCRQTSRGELVQTSRGRHQSSLFQTHTHAHAHTRSKVTGLSMLSGKKVERGSSRSSVCARIK